MEKEKLLDILNKAYKVYISDYSDYDPNLCHNGGKYSYTLIGVKKSNREWRVWYSTSSDIAFCSRYGKFQKCMSYYWDCFDCDNGEDIVTQDKLIEMINDFISIDLLNNITDHQDNSDAGGCYVLKYFTEVPANG